MTAATTVWLYLAAAAILAAWTMLRFPDVRPRSLIGASAAFVGGQLTPSLGLLLLPLALRDGVEVALTAVILPCFFIAWLTLGWLLRAIVDSIRAPRKAGLN